MNLEYCLVRNIHSKKKEVIFCITREGLVSLDRTITNTPLYEKVSELLKEEGFVEAEKLWFECRDKEVNLKELKKKLYDLGIDESKELTQHTLEMIEETYAPKPLKDNGDPNFFNPEYGQIFDFEPYPFNVTFSESDSTEVPLGGGESLFGNSKKKVSKIKNKPLFTYKLPDNQEVIPVCFNLFIDAVFKNDDSESDIENGTFSVLYELRGDMKNKQSSPTSKFLRPIKLDFRRVVYSTMKPTDPIIFQSVKTAKEIFEEEIDCLQDIDFNIRREVMGSGEQRPKVWSAKLNLSILELKDFIIDNGHIVFYMPKDEDFQQFCKLSDQVEEEINEEVDQVFPKTIVLKTLEELKGKMHSKMVTHSQEEEYEEAANQQKIISVIDSKLEILEDKEDYMSVREYREDFTIGKF